MSWVSVLTFSDSYAHFRSILKCTWLLLLKSNFTYINWYLQYWHVSAAIEHLIMAWHHAQKSHPTGLSIQQTSLSTPSTYLPLLTHLAIHLFNCTLIDSYNQLSTHPFSHTSTICPPIRTSTHLSTHAPVSLYTNLFNSIYMIFLCKCIIKTDLRS